MIMTSVFESMVGSMWQRSIILCHLKDKEETLAHAIFFMEEDPLFDPLPFFIYACFYMGTDIQ